MFSRHKPGRLVVTATMTALLTVTLGLGTAVRAEEKSDPKQKDGVLEKPLRVDDLPNPIPDMMEKIKEVGNEVGKGLSKAASEGAKGIQKVLKGGKQEDREKDRQKEP